MEAEQKVNANGKPGSFLVRENDNMFKLTWMSFQGKILHARLLEENGKYFINKKKKLSSIPRLVKHYQAHPRSSENALGTPIINSEMSDLAAQHIDQVLPIHQTKLKE